MARRLVFLPLAALLFSQHVLGSITSTTASSTTSSSTSVLSIADVSPTSVSTSASTTSTVQYLHIPLSTAAPDPISFAHVSGFYGPGSWAAWLLTICASWIRLFREPRVFDVNMWLYLLGVNWAAIELFKNTRETMALREAGADNWMRNCATIGAAMNVVVWGRWHAILQLATLVPAALTFDLDGEIQRSLTLLIGLVFPAVSMAVVSSAIGSFSSSMSEQEIRDTIPALYWSGMVRGSESLDVRDSSLWYSSTLGPLWLIFTLQVVLVAVCSYLPSESLSFDFAGEWSVLILPCTLYGFAILTALVVTGQNWSWWAAISVLPALVLTSLMIIPVCAMVIVLTQVVFSAEYFWRAYITRQVSIQDSCYFMPCAPQEISESGQSFPLLAGLFALIVAEVGLPLYQSHIRRRGEDAQFREEAERRFEMERVARSIDEVERTDAPGTIISSASGVARPGRINSGLMVEEGRARETRILSGITHTARHAL
jgi:hypothetical protein